MVGLVIPLSSQIKGRRLRAHKFGKTAQKQHPRARGAGVLLMSNCLTDSRRLGGEKKEIPITKLFTAAGRTGNSLWRYLFVI
jgi:hypothetical protein